MPAWSRSSRASRRPAPPSPTSSSRWRRPSTQERRVSDQIEALAKVAREEGDYLSEQFTLWFLKEQVEEVATMSDLLRVVERARENPMFAEDYLAREHPGEEGADPTAPPAAGGAL